MPAKLYLQSENREKGTALTTVDVWLVFMWECEPRLFTEVFKKSLYGFAILSACLGASCVLDSKSLILSKDGSMVGFKGPRIKMQKMLRSVRLVTTGAAETRDSVAKMFDKFKPFEESMC